MKAYLKHARGKFINNVYASENSLNDIKGMANQNKVTKLGEIASNSYQISNPTQKNTLQVAVKNTQGQVMSQS